MPINHLSQFQRQVLRAVEQVPTGMVTTYKLLATAVNRPNAARAVGNALNKNPELVTIPCHRVVAGNGQLGGYRLGHKQKVALLAREGVTVNAGRIEKFSEIVYTF